MKTAVTLAGLLLGLPLFGGEPARVDFRGDPLPAGALARFGTTRLRQGTQIEAVAFSPDGTILASGGNGLGVCLWDAKTLRLVRSFGAVETFSGVHALAFSPDGKVLATCSPRGVETWDVGTGRRLRLFKDYTRSRALFFADGGRTLYSHSTEARSTTIEPDRVVGWALADAGRPVVSPAVEKVRQVSASADGSRLALRLLGGAVKVWDVKAKCLLQDLKVEREVEQVALSADGRTVACLSRESMALFDAGSGRRLEVVELRALSATLLTWSPDGKRLAFEDQYHVHVYDVAARKVARTWEAHQPGLRGLAFSPDSKRVATAALNDCVVGLWDSATGDDVSGQDGHRWCVLQTVPFAGGKRLLSFAFDGRVICWDTSSGKRVWDVGGPGGKDAHGIAVSADGKTLAQGSAYVASTIVVVLRNPFTGEERDRVATTVPASISADLLLAFGGSDRFLAVVQNDSLYIRDLTKKDGPKGEPSKSVGDLLQFLPDGRSLLTIGGGRLRVLDVPSCNERRKVDLGVIVQRATATADGRRVAVFGEGAGKPVVRVVDVASGLEVREWSVANTKCRVLALSRDGRLLASGDAEGDSAVRLWEVDSGRLIRRLEGHYAGVSALVFGEDGRTLWSGSWDTSVLLWDITGRDRKKGRPPTSDDLERLWLTLAADDPAEAYPALWEMAGSPAESVPFLGERLRQGIHIDREQASRLVAQLDDRSMKTREEASRKLAALGPGVEPLLRDALAAGPTLEQRRRIEAVLEALPRGGTALRLHRALAALEHAGTEEAMRVLRELRGGPHPLVATAARAALERLTRNVR